MNFPVKISSIRKGKKSTSISKDLSFFSGPRGLPLVGYVPFLNEHDPVYPFKGM